MENIGQNHTNGNDARTCPRVVLFIEEDGGRWHAQQLNSALRSLGAHVTETTLKSCAFDTRTKTGLIIPGLEDELPDGVFVRSISTGTLEQITFRLGILHALSASGVRVWNSARVIERCVDKSTATFLFNRAGLPVPTTTTSERIDLASDFLDESKNLVSKPMFGSQGNGVAKITTESGLPPPHTLGHVHYLQNYIAPPYTAEGPQFADWRVIVSGGRALAAMKRRSVDWITNVHQGATPEPVSLTAQMEDLALGAARAVDADYAGVDLIKSPDGHLLVLEINSNPAWKGLQSVTGVEIGAELAKDFYTAVLKAHENNTSTTSQTTQHAAISTA